MAAKSLRLARSPVAPKMTSVHGSPCSRGVADVTGGGNWLGVAFTWMLILTPPLPRRWRSAQATAPHLRGPRQRARRVVGPARRGGRGPVLGCAPHGTTENPPGD